MPLDKSKAEEILNRMGQEALDPVALERKRKEELLSKVRTRLDLGAVNKSKVTEGDPNMSYIWVNKNEDRQITFQGLGYSVCKDPKVMTSFKRPDGTHTRGDLILYEIPKEEREALENLAAVNAIEGLDSPKEMFQNFAEANNVPVMRG